MEVPEYQHIVEVAFRRIEDALEDVDPDKVDVQRSGDVLTLTFLGKKKCILNTQRPTRQIWLAAGATAWHFDYDAKTERWLGDKDVREELFATVERLVASGAGVTLTI